MVNHVSLKISCTFWNCNRIGRSRDLPKMNISQDNGGSYIKIDCSKDEDDCSHIDLHIVKLSSHLRK